ncbi:Uncharacterised protein [Vibrio cholerae]|nr:Uncharacterised protein [Vibrio cholerae]
MLLNVCHRINSAIECCYFSFAELLNIAWVVRSPSLYV